MWYLFEPLVYVTLDIQHNRHGKWISFTCKYSATKECCLDNKNCISRTSTLENLLLHMSLYICMFLRHLHQNPFPNRSIWMCISVYTLPHTYVHGEFSFSFFVTSMCHIPWMDYDPLHNYAWFWKLLINWCNPRVLYLTDFGYVAYYQKKIP